MTVANVNEKRAFTISEATQYLGLGRSSIYRALERGELRRRKAGRRTLILREDLDRFLDGLTADA
jgi:excisionase family DNA binding protein